MKEVIRNIVYLIYSAICNALYKQEKNTILFSSFAGASYSDNPKAISIVMHKMYPEIKQKWIINNDNDHNFPKYVEVIKINSVFDVIRWISKSQAIVLNYEFLPVIKRKRHLFVQVWHGDRGFKKILYDSNFVSKWYVAFERFSGFCDYAVAGSNYGENTYRTAFKYEGIITKFGCPRNDILLSSDVENKASIIKNNLGISNDKYIIMYAPTLRREATYSDGNKQIAIIDLKNVINICEKKLSKKIVCLVRAHPGVNGIQYTYSDCIINVSKYDDMTDLLMVSDMLITDYSSSAGDFALLNRPIILFQPDIEEYTKKDRSFYFDINDSPYIIAKSQNELEAIVKKIDTIDFFENCHNILDFYCTYESGESSQKISEIIYQNMVRLNKY